MGPLISRRTALLSGLAACTAPPVAQADPVVEATIDGVTSYFTTAAKLTAGITAIVAAIRPAKVARRDRAQVGADITAFTDELNRMVVRQRQVVGDLGDYVRSVRANGFSETEHPRMWRALVTEMRALSDQVAIVYAMQDKAAWLRVALTPEEEMSLASVLRARSAALSQLSSLPPPRTPIEIDKLDALQERYLDLVRQLYELRKVLAEAQRRFA